MLYRIAIVEDDSFSAQKIEDYLQAFSKESGDVFDITRFSDGEKITSDYKPVYDIIYLEIRLKYLDGMAAAEYIRKLDKEVVIVFITKLSEYAIQGYSVGALGYLLKPVSYFAFKEQLKYSINKVNQKQQEYILITTDNGIAKINISNIIYIESFRNKLSLHTNTEDYTMICTMKEMENKLSGKGFFRCKNSFLVNLAFVKAIKGHAVSVGEHELTISRAKKKDFLNVLMQLYTKNA